MRETSWVSENVVGPMKHMAIVCLDRIVDVISTQDPVIAMRMTTEEEYD
jgi:hypothetical protein